MKSSHPPQRRTRRLRSTIIGGLATVVFFVFYLMFLERKNTEIEAYYQHLRAENPEVYLERVAELKGFKTYVEAFSKMHDYHQPKREAPPFLVGRWRLFAEPKNVNETYFPVSCPSGVEIEDGHVKFFGLARAFGLADGIHGVRYQIAGMAVKLLLDDGKAVPLTMVSYGTHLHHLEIIPPGAHQTYHGYLCK